MEKSVEENMLIAVIAVFNFTYKSACFPDAVQPNIRATVPVCRKRAMKPLFVHISCRRTSSHVKYYAKLNINANVM